MKHFSWVFATLFVTVMLSSCIIEQNYYFKKDLSGTYNIMVDVSAMEDFGATDSLPADSTFTTADLVEFKEYYNGMAGISHADAIFEDGVLNASYDFADITSLNSANNAKTSEGEDEQQKFNLFVFESSRDGLAVSIDRSVMEGDDSPSTPEDVEMMDGMLTITGNMNFEASIKSVESEIAIWNEEENSVTISIKFADLYDEAKDLNTLIRFR